MPNSNNVDVGSKVIPVGGSVVGEVQSYDDTWATVRWPNGLFSDTLISNLEVV